jgi:F0F1-type ATP synthase membrane subunit b/b'
MPVPDTDRTVADAIDRVLEAEREAAAAIAAAEATARAALDAAREERRSTLDRARARITRLHERAAARLETTLQQLDVAAADEARASAVSGSVTADVLTVVAARLTGEVPP